ncbi:MAG: hypothetical protein ACYTGS_03125, partial [Planctomycetota bacterium]
LNQLSESALQFMFDSCTNAQAMQRICHPLLISRRLFEQAKQRLESHPKSIEQRQLWQLLIGRFSSSQ